MEFSIEHTGLRELAADLDRAPLKQLLLSRTALEVSARHVKDDARELASGHRHATAYPQSIAYEVRNSLTGGEAEIGPTVGGPQWGLGDILEWGTSKSSPRPHMGPALDKNVPDFELGQAIAAEQSLR